MSDDALLKKIADQVDEIHDALYVEGSAGKPSLHERVSTLETKEEGRTWFDRVTIGAWVAVIVGGIWAVITRGAPH